MASLHWIDYVLFVGFLFISLGVGVYQAVVGMRQVTTQAFIMANRKLRVGPTVLSLLASYLSAIAVLGMPAEMYMFGSQMWLWLSISACLSLFLVERIAVPWIYPLRLTSVFQYFELRFKSKTLRMLTSVFGIFQSILYMGVAMYAPSAALYAVTGLPLSVTVPVMATVCITYTALGGLRAVIWTDVFQFIVMVGGMLLIAVKATTIVGGVGKCFDLAHNEGRMLWSKWDVDPRVRHTGWGLLVGGAFYWFAIYGFSQSSVQRYSASATLNQARVLMLLSIPSLAVSYSVFFLTGVIIVAYYAQIGCDPLASGQISNGNMLLPDFLNKEFATNPGIRGVFLAILYGGSLSSMSSALSGAAANIWEDFLKPVVTSVDERRATWMNRLIVVVLGSLATGFAFYVEQFPGSIIQVTTQILGAVNSPLFGMFLLGGLFRKTEAKGTIVGGIVGLAFNVYIGLGSLTVKGCHPTLPPLSVDQCVPAVNSTTTPSPVELSGMSHLFAVSYIWYMPIGAVTTIIVGLLSSYVFRYFDPSDDADVSDEVLIPLDKIFSFDFTEKDITNEPHKSTADDDTDLTLVNGTSKITKPSTHINEPEVISSLLHDTHI